MKFFKLQHKAFLAPMAGITDRAFRSLCTLQGAAATITELVSSHGIIQNQEKTLHMTKRGDEEKVFGVQLFGGEPEIMGKAASMIESECDFIDLNLGCPAQKVYKNGAGSALLTKPHIVRNIIRNIQKETSIPITVKMRIGLNATTITALEIAKLCEEENISLLTIHGRTKDQGYSGKANWDIIRQVKENVSIPVVGNGDITTPKTAKQRLENSGVDYLAVGRGASGNPSIFNQINSFLEMGKEVLPTSKQKAELFSQYLELAKKYSIPFFNQVLQAQHFIKGIKGAAKTRTQILKTKSLVEINSLVQTCLVQDRKN